MSARRAWSLVVGAAVAWSVPSTAAAQPHPGSRDISFGANGLVKTPIGTSDEWASDVVVDGQGRIVVAGSSRMGAVIGATTDFAVVRYLPNGQLDPDFGGDGIVTTPIGSSSDDVAEALAIQPDGKILVAGHYRHAVLPENFVVVRYHTDGTLDTSFGGTGKVVDFVSNVAFARDLVVQPDGKILLAGSIVKATTGYDPCVVRYLPNGQRDASFGVSGVAAPTINGHQFVYSVALTSTGRILLAGETQDGGPNDFLLARLDQNGELDDTFGQFGLVVTPFGPGNDGAYGMAVESDETIVLAGSTSVGANRDIALARYASSGSPDPGFDGDGKRTIGIGGDEVALDVVAQPNGKIVMAGYVYDPVTDLDSATLMRFNGDGTLDIDFGNGGYVLTPLESAGGGIFASLALQPDGKIVAAGYGIEAGTDFAVARYHGDPPDLIFADGFDGP